MQRGPTLDRTPTRGRSRPYSDGNSGDTPFTSLHVWDVGGHVDWEKTRTPHGPRPRQEPAFPLDGYAIFVGTLSAACEGSLSDLAVGPRLILGRERSHDNRAVHF